MKTKNRNNSDMTEEQANDLFPLGAITTSPGALEEIPLWDILTAIDRHRRGDWGDLCEEDQEENAFCLREGFRLFSRYYSRDGVRFWIITEADRSATTVLLPSEY